MTREERAYHYASKKNPSKFTVNEIAKYYDDGYTDGNRDAIDKACKFFWSLSLEKMDEYFSSSENLWKFTEDFKKAMEE